MKNRQGMGSLLLACAIAFVAPLASATPSGFQVTTVNLWTNDLAYNATSGEWLVAVPSYAAFGVGNSITRVSSTGKVLQSTYMGSEPYRIALSQDGSLGYVSLWGANAIRSFNGLTGAALTQVSLGSNYAEDLEVSPTDKTVVAASLANHYFSPRHEGVAIFKNGVLLPGQTPGHTGSNVIEFGADGSTLYGFNTETSERGFRTMGVSDSGVTVQSVKNQVFNGYTQDIQYDSGMVFNSNGEVVDAATGQKLGQFPIVGYQGSLLASVATGEAYFLHNSGVLTIFDLATFTAKATYSLGIQIGAGGTFTDLTLGANGNLAVNAGGEKIYLLTAVPEPGSAALLLLGLLGLAWRRSRQQA